MAPILSACMILDRCGDEIDTTLRCVQSADLEVSVFLCDNSPEELTADRLKWSFPGVEVLPQKKNTSLTQAYNSVIPRLTSRYHLMMDPGASFNPSLLRRMVSYMEEHPNIAVLSPRFFSEEGEELFFPRRQLSVRHFLGSILGSLGGFLRRWKEKYTFADQEAEMPTPVDSAPIPFLMVRTEIFCGLNGFDERFRDTQEDADLCRRIQESRRGSVVYHPDFRVFLHREVDETALIPVRTHRFRTVLRYFLKWGITW